MGTSGVSDGAPHDEREARGALRGRVYTWGGWLPWPGTQSGGGWLAERMAASEGRERGTVTSGGQDAVAVSLSLSLSLFFSLTAQTLLLVIKMHGRSRRRVSAARVAVGGLSRRQRVSAGRTSG